MIHFRYYSSSKNSRPTMSKALYDLLVQAVESVKAEDCLIVHLGTVGDERHRRQNPKSYHNHRPPDAIDILSVHLVLQDGRQVVLDCSDDLDARKAIAKVWEALGGSCSHTNNKKYGHLHLQTS